MQRLTHPTKNGNCRSDRPDRKFSTVDSLLPKGTCSKWSVELPQKLKTPDPMWIWLYANSPCTYTWFHGNSDPNVSSNKAKASLQAQRKSTVTVVLAPISPDSSAGEKGEYLRVCWTEFMLLSGQLKLPYHKMGVLVSQLIGD